MPMPPAAFSPLTTTKSTPSSSRRSASIARATRRPGGADDVADEQDRGHGGHGSGPSPGGAYWRPCRQSTTAGPRAGSRPAAEPRRATRRRRSTRRRRRPPRRRRARRRAALDPARRAPARDPRRLGAAARGGPGHAAVHHRRADRAAAQPVRGAAAARRACRAGSRCWSSSSGCSCRRSALVARAGRPDRRPGRRPSAPTSRASSTTPTPSWPTCSAGSTTTASTSRSQAPGRTALETLGERRRRGLRRARDLHARGADDRSSRRSIALILIIVLSVYMLLYGERIGAAVRGVVPRGDGTPEDDFPDADPARRVRLRPRPAPVLDDHGRERGRDAVDRSARSASSPTARRTRWSSAPSTASPS